MRRRTGRMILLASALLAGAAWWAWREAPPSPATPSLAANPTSADAIVKAKTAGDSPPAAALSPRADLPADDAPLAGLLGPLADRANAGDRKAACRLAMELLRCEHLADYAYITSASPAATGEDAGAASEGGSEWEIRMRRWNQHWLAQCESVPASLRGQGGRYLAQAARAGEPEAMVRYAEGHQWPPSGRGTFAGPAFDAWRRDAAGMIHRAVESGYPGAVFTLMIAYGEDKSLLASLVPDDPEQALTMSLLYSRLYGANEMAQFSRGVTPAVEVRARRRAEEMHQRLFQGRRFRGYPYPTPGFIPPMDGESTHRFCRDP